MLKGIAISIFPKDWGAVFLNVKKNNRHFVQRLIARLRFLDTGGVACLKVNRQLFSPLMLLYICAQPLCLNCDRGQSVVCGKVSLYTT